MQLSPKPRPPLASLGVETCGATALIRLPSFAKDKVFRRSLARVAADKLAAASQSWRIHYA